MFLLSLTSAYLLENIPGSPINHFFETAIAFIILRLACLHGGVHVHWQSSRHFCEPILPPRPSIPGDSLRLQSQGQRYGGVQVPPRDRGSAVDHNRHLSDPKTREKEVVSLTRFFWVRMAMVSPEKKQLEQCLILWCPLMTWATLFFEEKQTNAAVQSCGRSHL